MKSIRIRKLLLVALVLFALLGVPQTAQANLRFENGGELPFYARLEREGVITDGEWVAIVFYRPPGCIPPDFNLLDFFDFANAWGCGPPTTDGFEIWKNSPGIDMAPIQQNLHGRGAVPVWFVSMSELEAVTADDNLVISELALLPSLQVGTAHHFQEILHPFGGANKNHLELSARGFLQDGSPFKVHAISTEANYQARIWLGE